jgi:hypothetical protein
MELAIVLILVAVVGLAVFLSLRGRSVTKHNEKVAEDAEKANAPQDLFKEPMVDVSNPHNFEIGYIVDRHEESWAVRGIVWFDEKGYKWREIFLETAREERVYLSVEEDPDLKLALWTGVEVDLTPSPTVLEYNSEVYHRKETGTAKYRTEGTTDLPTGPGEADYCDYEGPNGKLLSFERFNGGKWEVSTGETIHPSELKAYPPLR